MIRGCDFSTSHPRLDGLVRDGRRFVIRYLYNRTDGQPDPTSQSLTAQEAAAIKEAGLNLVLNWETAGDMSGGSAVGVNHAKRALDAAKALGVPVRAIYFSDEQDTGSAQLSVAYMRGVKSVLDPAGVTAGYYSRDRVRAIKDAMPDVLTWQACFGCSESAFDPRVAIRQTLGTHAFAGGQIDDDLAMTDDYGQSWLEDQGHDMTPDEVKDLVNHMLSTQRWARFAMGMWKEAGDDVQGIEQAEVKGRDFAKKAVASTPDSP